MKNDELRPCPVCGSKVDVSVAIENDEPFYIVCELCFLSTRAFANEFSLIEYWNTRQSESWIPVSQKLPGEDWVLCYLEEFQCKKGMRVKTGIWIDENMKEINVTHWRELPLAPIEKGDG